MAHTEITLTNNNGVLVPSADSVSVVSGDTIAFSTTDGSTAVLFFSPGAVAVLSPAPSGPVTSAGSEKTTFTFTSSDAGAYSVFFETSTSASHPPFPVQESELLYLETDAKGSGFGGPVVQPNTSNFVGAQSFSAQAESVSRGGPSIPPNTAGVAKPNPLK
jgi:plastocyanin